MSLFKNIKASYTYKTWNKLIRRRTALIGVSFILFFVLMALVGLVWTPYPPNTTNAKELLTPPSLIHPFGTDDMGRDVLSRLMAGASISITVGIVSVMFALIVGTCLGLVSGYYRGWLGAIIDKFVEAIWAFPSLILAMVLTVLIGTGIKNVIIALAIVQIPSFARIVRAMTLSIRENEYVQSAVAIGLNNAQIIFRYILPNLASVVIVQASLCAASAIIQESTLSFLGLGIVPPDASWGAMLKLGYTYLELAPWVCFVPGVCIVLMVLGLNFLGDGLRDALDVRIRNF